MHTSYLFKCLKRNTQLTFVRSLCTSSSFTLEKDYYKALELEKGCSDKDVRDAYIRLSKEHHPDKNPDAKSGTSEKRFVEIHEAYSVLSKPAARRRYDEYRSNYDADQEFSSSYEELIHRYNQRNDFMRKKYERAYPSYGPYEYTKYQQRSGGVDRRIPLTRLLAMVVLGMFIVGVIEFNIVKRVVQGPDEIIEGMPIYHSNMVPPNLSKMDEEQQKIYHATKRRIITETVRAMNAEKEARDREQDRLRAIIENNKEQESSSPKAVE